MSWDAPTNLYLTPRVNVSPYRSGRYLMSMLAGFLSIWPTSRHKGPSALIAYYDCFLFAVSVGILIQVGP